MNDFYPKYSLVFFLGSFCLFGLSCESKDVVHHYREEILSEFQPLVSDSHEGHKHQEDSQDMQWVLPSGWSESPGSGMRLASLYPDPTDQDIECTIVQLGLEAGNLEANVVRWLGQLGITDPDDEVLSAFLARQKRFQTADHHQGILIDFSDYLPGNAETGMLAAIIHFDSKVIFVKLMAPPDVIDVVEGAFFQLCQSFSGPSE